MGMSPYRRNLYMFAGLGVVLFVPLILFLTSTKRNAGGFKSDSRVRRGAIDWHLGARGRVEGATSQEIKLASRVVGRLKQVTVADGDPVR
jgi:hypothetical protein